MNNDIKITIYLGDTNNLFILITSKKIFLKQLSDEGIIERVTREYKKLEFEKRKQISFNNMLDKKLIKLNKKEIEINIILNKLKKEKEDLMSSI